VEPKKKAHAEGHGAHRDRIAKRAAKEFKDGMYANLGKCYRNLYLYL
jgi:hypothetical protein